MCVEGKSKEYPKLGKSEKAGKEAISRAEEKAPRNGVRIVPILQVSPKLQGFENQYGNNSKLTPLCLQILNLADQDRYHLLLFIC